MGIKSIALAATTLFLSISVHAATVNYTLDDVFLVDGTQMTGAFDWTYTIGDFEGGSGVFTALEIPWQPTGTAPPLEEPGMVLTIENNQIEISLDGNFHDYGLNISLKFVQSLSATQSSLIDLTQASLNVVATALKISLSAVEVSHLLSLLFRFLQPYGYSLLVLSA